MTHPVKAQESPQPVLVARHRAAGDVAGGSACPSNRFADPSRSQVFRAAVAEHMPLPAVDPRVPPAPGSGSLRRGDGGLFGQRAGGTWSMPWSRCLEARAGFRNPRSAASALALKERDLSGVKLVIGDAHKPLTN